MCTKSKKQAMCKKYLDPITVVKMQLTQDQQKFQKLLCNSAMHHHQSSVIIIINHDPWERIQSWSYSSNHHSVLRSFPLHMFASFLNLHSGYVPSQ